MWNGNNNFGGYSYQPSQYGYNGYTSPSYQQQVTQQTGVNTNSCMQTALKMFGSDSFLRTVTTSSWTMTNRWSIARQPMQRVKPIFGVQDRSLC